MSKPLIETHGITKNYVMGDQVVHALRGISVAIEPGEFVAIMGPSGSGKSTFMNLIGCLDRPTSGEYLLDGQPVAKMSDDDLAEIRNRKIGFVFQSFNLVARTSALRNVELPLAYSGVPRAERRERAAEALTLVGLADRLEHEPSELSGGQQQRVALARAIVTGPALLLADEPTGALDSHSTAEVLALFDQLAIRGRTVVVITHEHDVAEHAKRIVHMGDGQILTDERQVAVEADPPRWAGPEEVSA